MYTLWDEAQLGPLHLKNRVVRSATNEHLSQPDGQLSQAWVDALVQLAEHEVGLIITGHCTVEATQRADEGQPVLDRQTAAEPLQQAAQGVHAHNAKLIAQLSHSGLKAPAQVNGPADFTLEELDALVERFVFAARLCQRAGLDGVQIHTAHGYLLSSFLNPKENTRTDEYGGSLEHRFLLPRRIISAVRAACGPGFALLVKADSNGCGDLHGLLKLYQAAGVDAVEVSGVDFAAKTGVKAPFYLEALLSACGQCSLPLILVGGIFSKQTAQQVLDAGIPFVAFSRALICQSDFIAKMKSGEAEESACLACNGCYKIYRQRPVRCIQHTEAIPQLTKVFGCH